MLLFARIERYYYHVAEQLDLGRRHETRSGAFRRSGRRAWSSSRSSRSAKSSDMPCRSRCGLAAKWSRCRRHRPRRHPSALRALETMGSRGRPTGPAQPAPHPGRTHRRFRPNPSREGTLRHRLTRLHRTEAPTLPNPAQPTRPAARHHDSRTHRRYRRHASDSLGLSICPPTPKTAALPIDVRCGGTQRSDPRVLTIAPAGWLDNCSRAVERQRS